MRIPGGRRACRYPSSALLLEASGRTVGLSDSDNARARFGQPQHEDLPGLLLELRKGIFGRVQPHNLQRSRADVDAELSLGGKDMGQERKGLETQRIFQDHDRHAQGGRLEGSVDRRSVAEGLQGELLPLRSDVQEGIHGQEGPGQGHRLHFRPGLVRDEPQRQEGR